MGGLAVGFGAQKLVQDIRTLPGKQWAIGRLCEQAIKTILDERGIEIPFPQTTVWFGEGRITGLRSFGSQIRQASGRATPDGRCRGRAGRGFARPSAIPTGRSSRPPIGTMTATRMTQTGGRNPRVSPLLALTA